MQSSLSPGLALHPDSGWLAGSFPEAREIGLPGNRFRELHYLVILEGQGQFWNIPISKEHWTLLRSAVIRIHVTPIDWS